MEHDLVCHRSCLSLFLEKEYSGPVEAKKIDSTGLIQQSRLGVIQDESSLSPNLKRPIDLEVALTSSVGLVIRTSS